MRLLFCAAGQVNHSSVALTFLFAEVKKYKTGQRRLCGWYAARRAARRTGTLLRTSRCAAYRPLALLVLGNFSGEVQQNPPLHRIGP